MPFNRFPGVDVLLGPEMRSTGEVMGIDPSFGLAFMKAQLAAGQFLPASGCVFISVNDHDKSGIIVPAKTFQKLGFTIMSTRGTAAFLAGHGVQCQVVNKVYEGRPNVIDHIKNVAEASQKAADHGMRKVEVKVKGPGPGQASGKTRGQAGQAMQ